MRRLAIALLGLAAVALVAQPGAALVGGQDSTNPDGLRRHVVNVRLGTNFCSATPITPTVLLTAAHCFATPGGWYATSLSAAFLPRRTNIKAVALHPEYSSVARFGRDPMADLALVQLEAPLPADIRPVPLDRAGAKAGEELMVAGYGRNEGASAEGALVLREVKLTVMERQDRVHEIVLTETGKRMDRPGRGTCRGDSGGPAFRITPTGPQIVGVSSWSRGPSRENICGILSAFVDVAVKRPWIERQLAAWGERLPN